MYVVALPLPVNGLPDWTHMLQIRPGQIATESTYHQIHRNTKARRKKKIMYQKKADRAQIRKESCRDMAHQQGGQNTIMGRQFLRLANYHAVNETTWRGRAVLEERGEIHFRKAGKIHRDLRRT